MCSEITWDYQGITECSLTNTYTSIHSHSQARGTVTAEGSFVVDAMPIHADAWGLALVNICPEEDRSWFITEKKALLSKLVYPTSPPTGCNSQKEYIKMATDLL